MHTITALHPSDPAAQQIVSAYMTDVASRWYGRPATPAEVARALADEPYDDLQEPSGVLLVALGDGHPVGCAGICFVDGVGELTKVFTRPEHRGHGVGSQLLHAAEQSCRTRGVTSIRLDTRAALTEACALYERSGFVRVPAFSDEPYSDRWYRKTLDGRGPQTGR